MHESWWISIGLKKPNLSAPIEYESNNMTTNAYQLQTRNHKGATLTFSFIISFLLLFGSG
jgi:hypothetical protein